MPVLISYLLGSITFSYVIGRLKGIDIREHGSGNAGATNTFRTLGITAGIIVLILDLLKGIAAVWIGKWFAPEYNIVAVLCGIFAIIGHNWPIYFGFKGGKGVATSLGVSATICFLPTLIVLVIIIVVIAITRYVSLGSLVFAVLLPIFIMIIYDPIPMEVLGASIVLAIFVIMRHRNNIIKLWRGEENKLGKKL